MNCVLRAELANILLRSGAGGHQAMASGPPETWVVEISKEKDVSKDVILAAIDDAHKMEGRVSFKLVTVMTTTSSDSYVLSPIVSN